MSKTVLFFILTIANLVTIDAYTAVKYSFL